MVDKDEPEVFKIGKKYHKKIQEEWENSSIEGSPDPEHFVKISKKRKGRFDILVDELGDELNVIVEIKSTNWDKIKRSNIRKNARRHIRQIWKYIDLQQETDNVELCVGVIYPQLPSDPEIIAHAGQSFQSYRSMFPLYSPELSFQKQLRFSS